MGTRTIEERVTYLDKKVAENASGIEGLRRAVAHLATRMDEGFAAVARRFEAVDKRFEAVDRRFEAIERRLDVMDQRFVQMDQRIEALHERLDRWFQRMFGAQIAILIAVLGALTTLLAAALRG